ncbi:hybrid sensor histidine kinase/response regulator [Stutzerimonas stutzeri]|uniref:hybrid sensor histidine kinase/response regulator n=1 Tax=Stutzerimonas stutzeri TaxID=316 RepID=UPI00210B2A7A|nr:PAS domain-containing sensor histidine kinase [Stutzerimonas stutzeri]MCQ4321726.1 PAS domain S-box protein [Stutzerimonas stutzeri]
MQDVTLSDVSLIAQDRYRLLVDAVTDYAIYMLDANGSIASWNAGARRFKGYEEAEIIGQHFSRFYTDEDRAVGMPQKTLDTAVTEGRFEGEGWRVRKDGTRFWCHVVVDPIWSPDGSLLGFAKITRDLTERKLAEESLKKSEQQFRLLVQGVTDYAIYMLDPTGIVTNWNVGAQRIKGYLPDEIVGHHYSVFFTEEDRQNGAPQRGLDTALREGRFVSQGLRVRKNGSCFWASVAVDPIHSDTGALLGFAKVTRDITESVEAQRELEKAREALFQSQKMESLGRLTGGIAHDFNNLLMAVLGGLEIVRRRVDDDPRIVPLLDNAIQGAQRGISLSQRMLAFARRQELHLELVDVSALVRGMADLLRQSLGPRIEIEMRFPLSLKPILADPHQVELALLNLAVNARDAMPDGGTVTLSASEHRFDTKAGPLESGDYVCLALTDEGTGMDEMTLEQAMEPFFTTKGVGKGTGLGLSMVHGLAAQSGGRLLLKSEKGRGTTAELWLPLAVNLPVPAEKGGVQPPESQSLMALKVLAVDDDALVLMTTAAMLEELGCEVIEADSAEQALEILAQQGIDLVLTDQAMPQMTGAQLADFIQQRYPQLPVILATGYADTLGGRASSLPRLGKPFDMDALAEKITAVMSQR